MTPIIRILALPALLAAPMASALSLDGRLEAGIGAMGLYVPDYRGADHYSVVPVPYPYVYYQGKRVQITREGLRARLFDIDRLSASLSLNASPPVDNDGRPPREGMPELLPVFEIGPSLDVLLHENDAGNVKLRVPARAVLATDFKEFEQAGWLVEPHVRAERRGIEWNGWRGSTVLSGGVLWGSADYHEYFYGVAPEFATPTRQAYAAESGYSGARTTASWSFGKPPWRLVAFAQYDWLEDVAFADSPLVQSEQSVFAGVMVMYRLYQSRSAEETGP